jgi:hypothetical protein
MVSACGGFSCANRLASVTCVVRLGARRGSSLLVA